MPVVTDKSDDFLVCSMCDKAQSLSSIFGSVYCEHYDRAIKAMDACDFCSQKSDIEPGLYSLVRGGRRETVEVYKEVSAAGTCTRARHDSNYTGFKLSDMPLGQYLKPLKFMAAG